MSPMRQTGQLGEGTCSGLVTLSFRAARVGSSLRKGLDEAHLRVIGGERMCWVSLLSQSHSSYHIDSSSLLMSMAMAISGTWMTRCFLQIYQLYGTRILESCVPRRMSRCLLESGEASG